MIILKFFMILARIVFLFLTIGLLLFGKKNRNDTYKLELIICFFLFISTFFIVAWVVIITNGILTLLISAFNNKDEY